MKIKELREANDIQQKKFAAILKIPPSTLSQYETGNREPSIDTVSKIASYFDVTTDFIYGVSETVTCKECGLTYSPLEKFDMDIHNELHAKWEAAINKFGFCIPYIDRERLKSDARNALARGTLTFEEECGAQLDVFMALFSRSLEASNYDLNHIEFEKYIAMLLNQSYFENKIEPNIYKYFVTNYGKKVGIENGSSIYDIMQIKTERLENNSYSTNISHKDLVTNQEFAHIEKYRSTDEHGKTLVDTVLDIEHARCTTTPKTDIKTEQFTVHPARDVIQFQLSEYKASAGRGTYLGPEAFTTIMVVSNTLTKRALFGVPVSGDSMEPTYNDGDILIVERADALEGGEIGIFTLDGEGYVKECGKGELISLNSKYEPIPMNDGIVLNGRVIGILDREWIVE